MEDIIHVLPDSVANQIAAGEVVQRPSSIVKEMVENSIDAGAHNIQVLVVDGGKANVQIVDDGKGMSETDARLSFERHATSKIRSAADLFSLSTMGFRGEALASIAAVAHVELKTRREEDELGTSIEIAGSKVVSQEPVSCPVGSNFSVKDLFYNVPARRKFLKSAQTEMTNIVQDFERIVLVNPDISFNLFNNGAEMFRLPATSVRQRIIDVFGKKINADLLPIEAETSLVKISGYVTKPESSKKKGAKRFFFVNGRYMQHNYFQTAVMRAYDNLIPQGDQVSFFIYMAVDPASIDVNVHPTKTEIKFDNDQAIWQVLYATVKETLGKFCNVPMIDFDVEGKPEIPAFIPSGSHGTKSYSPPTRSVSDYNPFKKTGSGNGQHVESNWESLYEGLKDLENDSSDMMPSDYNPTLFDDGLVSSSSNDDGDGGLVPSETNVEVEAEADTPYIYYKADGQPASLDPTVAKFQYKGRYIVLPTGSGLMLVDQNRAHIRVLYERNLKSMTTHGHLVQKIMFEEIVTFTPAEAVVIEEIFDDITKLGFELTNLGGGSFSVSGVPSNIQNINVDEVLHNLVYSAMDKTGNINEDARESMALMLAKSFAIGYGDVLSQVEMTNLLRDLFALPTPARTPDGKIVYSLVENKVIDRLF